MPIFEYRCDDCGTKFEKLVRRSGGVAEQVLCPSCGRDHLARAVFHLRGPRERTAKSGSSSEAMPSCASGMCQTPGMCGRNFN